MISFNTKLRSNNLVYDVKSNLRSFSVSSGFNRKIQFILPILDDDTTNDANSIYSGQIHDGSGGHQAYYASFAGPNVSCIRDVIKCLAKLTGKFRDIPCVVAFKFYFINPDLGFSDEFSSVGSNQIVFRYRMNTVRTLSDRMGDHYPVTTSAADLTLIDDDFNDSDYVTKNLSYIDLYNNFIGELSMIIDFEGAYYNNLSDLVHVDMYALPIYDIDDKKSSVINNPYKHYDFYSINSLTPLGILIPLTTNELHFGNKIDINDYEKHLDKINIG